MDKYKNKYRITSTRLQNWDYGSNGVYFITICTENREHFFGEIIETSIHSDSTMQLNELGVLVEKYWMEIPQHFPFVELGNFVVMPNHTHGILIIDKNGKFSDGENDNIDDGLGVVVCRGTINRASTNNHGTDEHPTTKNNGGFSGNKNPTLNQNISRIIRWYKGRCTFEMRKIHADFAWQTRFHDHIIRNSKSFENIQTYIENNPKNWNSDKFM